ncbi:MAG: TonB-dependent receptor [Bacteroidales bacterium]|nr:TonB-dependent receptor [Bacteroidales bacterium]
MVGYQNDITDWFKFDLRSSFINQFSYIRFALTPSAYMPKWDDFKSVDMELDLFFTPNEKLDITLGGYYRSNFRNMFTINLTPLPNPDLLNTEAMLHKDDKLRTYAVFSQVDYTPIDKLQFVIGLRAEQLGSYKMFIASSQGLPGDTLHEGIIPKEDLQLVPNVAVLYSINENNVLKLLYGQGIKMPSIFDNYDIFNRNTRDDNLPYELPTLKREKMECYEVSYVGMFNKKYMLGVNLFYNYMENLISRKGEYINDVFTASTSNWGNYRTFGSELSLQARVIDPLDIRVMLTYQETSDLNYMDVEPAFSPNLLGYLQASYQLPSFGSKDKSKKIIALTGNYVDEMYSHYDIAPAANSPTQNPDEDGYIAIGRIGDKTADYFVINANLRLENIIIPGITFGLHVSNLFDTEIHYPTYNNNRWADKGIIADGRRLNVSLSYRF